MAITKSKTAQNGQEQIQVKQNLQKKINIQRRKMNERQTLSVQHTQQQDQVKEYTMYKTTLYVGMFEFNNKIQC